LHGHTKWLPTAVLLLLAVACSYPANRAIDWLVWLPVVALDWWSARRIAGSIRDTGLSSFSTVDSESDSGQPLQQLTRYRTADGSERIVGKLFAEFAAGDRNATLYVAFCPPFERLPALDAQIGDESQATIKVAQLLHNGAQLEVRLSQAAAVQQTVAVDFFATTRGV
jgi:hypothetical protein